MKKSKRIGICTIAIDNSYNYGNKLQTYALQQFLRQNDFFPETIRYQPDYLQETQLSPKTNILKKLTDRSILQFISDVHRITNRFVQKRTLESKRLNREEKFKIFENKYINYSEKIYYADSDFSELVQEKDCFITGSDQVWNPYYEGKNAFFYLGFAPEGKRIAYAPSIAHNEIPGSLNTKYSNWLSQIDYLSIRESVGQDLLKNEFGLDAKLVCDPVFLLTRKEWHDIAVCSRKEDRYFAVYILGKKTVEIKRMIRQYAKRYRLQVVDVYSKDETTSAFAGPEEFLGILENAEFVFTDSFHGTAFSLIFNKPMVLVDRDGNTKTSSRVNTILRVLNIENRDAEWILHHPSKMMVDYTEADKKLASFVASSKAFLLGALGKK